MDLWKKVWRSELSFRREGTWRRPKGLITKSLKLKYCSRSSLPNVLSQPPKKLQKTEKNFCGGGKNLKDHWPFS